MRIATYSVTFAMVPTMLTAFVHKWPAYQKMDGSVNGVEDALTATAKLLALAKVVDGMLTTQFVTPVISKGTKVLPAHAVVELIGILRSEK